MTTKEIAARIDAHLKRFEADLAPLAPMSPYWHANAHAAHGWIYVCYVSYQGYSALRKADALAYLEWLDAGYVGRHWRVLRAREVQR